MRSTINKVVPLEEDVLYKISKTVQHIASGNLQGPHNDKEQIKQPSQKIMVQRIGMSATEELTDPRRKLTTLGT